MNSKVRLNTVLFVVSIASTIFVWFQYETTPADRDNPILLTIFYLFSAILITDRLASLESEILSSRENEALVKSVEQLEDKRENEANRFPALLAGATDLIVFPNSRDGLKYCETIAGRANWIKNTVLRYGRPTTVMVQDSRNLYQGWIDIKKMCLEGSCDLTEIVSSHLSMDDPQIKFMAEADRISNYYRPHRLDEMIHPMLQMTIFSFDSFREVVFGWEFPGIMHGKCFASRNRELVDYFESYFNHFISISIPTTKSVTVAPPQSN